MSVPERPQSIKHEVWFAQHKRYGNHTPRATFSMPKAFSAALRQLAAEETSVAQASAVPRQVSQSEILITLALRGNKRLRQLHRHFQQQFDSSTDAS